MAKLTKAQREWRPGMPKKRRSTKVMFASTVLLLEAFVVFFGTLAVFGLRAGRIPAGPGLLGGDRACAWSTSSRARSSPSRGAWPWAGSCSSC